MKYTEPPENLPVVPTPPPASSEPKTTETEPKDAVHFRDPHAGDMVADVSALAAGSATGAPASRSLQPIRLAMTELKKRSPRASDDLLWADEVAVMLRSSRASVYRLAAGGRVPFYKLPGGLRFKRIDIETYLEACRHEPNSNASYGNPAH